MADVRIMVVEDERIVAEDLKETLYALGYIVTCIVNNGEEAIEKASQDDPDLILMDIMLAGELNGIEAAQKIKEIQPIPIIYLTAYADEEMLERAKITRPYGYLVKPFEEKELKAAIELAVYNEGMERKIASLNSMLNAIRTVNQLIVKEKDKNSLLLKTCETLQNSRGYELAWILLLDDKKQPIQLYQSGIKKVQKTPKLLKDIIELDCVQTLLKNPKKKIHQMAGERLPTCPFDKDSDSCNAILSVLEHSGTLFGVVCVGSHESIVYNQEEIDLFLEVAEDIGLALYNFERAEEQKRNQEEKRKSQERFLSIFQNAGDGILYVDKDGKVLEVNPAFVEITGISRDHIINKSALRLVRQFVSGKDLEKVLSHFKKLFAGEPTSSYEVVFNNRVVEVNSPQGSVSGGFVTMLHDITERKEAEKRIQFERELVNAIMDHSPDRIYFKDVDSKFIRINNACSNSMGFATPEAAVGYTDYDVFDKEHAHTAFLDEQNIIKSGKPILGVEEKEVWPDGSITWVSTTKAPLRDVEGNLIGTYGISRDITNAKKAEEERQKLFTAIEQTDEFVLITDQNAVIEYVNPSFLRFTGYSREELIGEKTSVFKSGKHEPGFYKEMWDTITNGEIWKGQLSNKKKDGSIYFEENTITPIFNENNEIINFVSVKRDVTEQYELEKRLRQSQKMEAIGTLAGGIAHDFNNILTPIFGYTEMLMTQVAPSSESEEFLEHIKIASKRAKDLVQQILAFSREMEQEKKPTMIHLVVKEALKLLRASLPATIEIHQHINDKCGLVAADPTQIHQVVMNLCTNAFHAMDEKGGILEVTLRPFVVDINNVDTFQHLEEGNYLELVFSDSGTGMEEVIVERIFDPFFTTKAPGEGTGLGLSTVHGIVLNHGGEIRVESEMGVGTTFSVYLPVRDESFDSMQENHDNISLQHGQEHILFIDDEEEIAIMGKMMLERLDYKVTMETSSEKALEMYLTNQEKFDLIITDHTMPRLTGIDLATKVNEINPNLPIIICTGFSKNISTDIVKELGIKAIITKPYEYKVFSETISSVLREAQNK